MKVPNTPEYYRERLRNVECRLRRTLNEVEGLSIRDSIEYLDIKTSLMERCEILNSMFLATPEEIERFRQVNAKLIDLHEKMRLRARKFWIETVTLDRIDDYDQCYELESEIKVEFDPDYNINTVKLPEDEYYGSDFELALAALVDIMTIGPSLRLGGGCFIESYLIEGGDDPGDVYDYRPDVGKSWVDGPLNRPEFKDVRVGYTTHAIVCLYPFSIPDLLRIRRFNADINLKIWHKAEMDPKFINL